jgi:signal transduction histidine kinase/ligand-binding sensor domain-containing protein
MHMAAKEDKQLGTSRLQFFTQREMCDWQYNRVLQEISAEIIRSKLAIHSGKSMVIEAAHLRTQGKGQPARARLLSSSFFFCVRIFEQSRPRKFWRTFWICMLFGLCCFPTFALHPNQPLAQLYHSSWGPKQGVTGNVTALAQTTDGYLWVGTTDGLLRFDGISFERYEPENGSLPATSVSALMAVPGGGLWVGFYRGGASFIKDGQVTNYSESDGFPVYTVRGFARDRSGAIWAAAVGGLVRLDGKRWEKRYTAWNYPHGETPWTLLADRDGTLWVDAGNQIMFMPAGQKRFEATGIEAGGISFLTQAPDGSIWFHDDQRKTMRGFCRDQDSKFQLLPNIDIFADSGMFDRNGAFWLGGDGLYRIPFSSGLGSHRLAGALEKLTSSEGLSNDDVKALMEDREGNIWVGTDGGLDRFRHRNVTWFPLRGGPFTLVAGPGNTVWAGSRGNTPFARVEDRKMAAGGPTDVFTAYRDPDGSIWFGGSHTLVHWQNGRFVDVPAPRQVLDLSRSAKPPNAIIVSAITKDHSGSLWVAFGGSGEFRLANGKWTFVKILPDHPDWSAGYAFTDTAGRVWLLWGDRVARYDRGNVRVFGAKEGLAIGPPNIIAEGDQRIWIGGESGLSFFKDGEFHTIKTAENSGFTTVTGIVATRNSDLWLSTGPGIVHIPATEVQDAIDDPDHKVAFDLFNLVSDLPEPTQRGEVYSSAAIQANDGSIWFAMRNGAVRVDPAHIYRNPFPPPVSIRSIMADNKSYSPFSDLKLPALTKDLRIEYAGLSLSIPERVRFRYKLEGRDRDWQNVGSRREAFYTDLPAGNYHFRVIACNNDGVWNETGATLNFSVAPAWFQTAWFRVFCVGVFFLLLWALYQLRLRQLEQRFRVVLDARVNERTRIARELHDTLLQSFQGLLARLQAASNLLPTRPDRAKERLDAAIDQASQAIAEGRDAVLDLRLSTVVSNELAAAIKTLGEELGASGDDRESPVFDVAIEGAPRELRPLVRDEIYRIAAEALRNAFNHAQAKRIEAELHYDDHEVRVRIRDNGRGIEPHVAGGRPGHFGLDGMRERARVIDAKLDVWSNVGSGTEVELTVPARHAYETGKHAAHPIDPKEG